MSTMTAKKIEARREQAAEMVTRLMGEYDDVTPASTTGRSFWIDSANKETGVTASTLVTVLVLPSGTTSVDLNTAWSRTNAAGEHVAGGVLPEEVHTVSTYERVEAAVFAHTDAVRGLMGLDVEDTPRG